MPSILKQGIDMGTTPRVIKNEINVPSYFKYPPWEIVLYNTFKWGH